MSSDRTTILITGGAGFIGSHLCEKALEAGFEVVNIDNFDDYYDPSIKRLNIERALMSQGYHLCEGDIRDQAYIKQVFHDYKPDVVVHLAAMAGVQPSLQNPEVYYDVNVNGTLQLLRTSVSAAVYKFIFASSSSVYGNNQVPFSESDNTDRPVSPYASSKKAGELLCHVYHTLNNITVHCLRFFTVVGPRQRPDLAVHKFVSAITHGRTIHLRGDVSSSRDYTSVYDTVDGIMGSIDRVLGLHSPEYKIYNLGNSYPVRLDQMIEVIENSLNTKAKIEYVDFMQGDVNHTFADIDLAKSDLQYQPHRSFQEAVNSFVEWYQENQGVVAE